MIAQPSPRKFDPPSASIHRAARVGLCRTTWVLLACSTAGACTGDRFDTVTGDDAGSRPGAAKPSSAEPSNVAAHDSGPQAPTHDASRTPGPTPDPPAPTSDGPNGKPEPVDTSPSARDAGSTGAPTSTANDGSNEPVEAGPVSVPTVIQCSDAGDCVGPPRFDGGDPLGAGGLPSGLPTGTAGPDAAPPDECPSVADQTERGACGCGFVSTVECESLEMHLVHRYSFDGTGTAVTDSVGDADGAVRNGELDGSGSLELDGDQTHAELPAGIVSALDNATLEVWARWDGGEPDQRIFNFGTPSANDGPPISYISLSPRGGTDTGVAVSIRPNDAQSSESIRLDDSLPTGEMQHLAVTFDSDANSVVLYIQGQRRDSVSTQQDISELQDAYNWLGRPLYWGYPNLDGALFEFRIYDAALSSEEIAQSFELGPDATFSAEL